jgi:hypothetical protein
MVGVGEIFSRELPRRSQRVNTALAASPSPVPSRVPVSSAVASNFPPSTPPPPLVPVSAVFIESSTMSSLPPTSSAVPPSSSAPVNPSTSSSSATSTNAFSEDNQAILIKLTIDHLASVSEKMNENNSISLRKLMTELTATMNKASTSSGSPAAAGTQSKPWVGTLPSWPVNSTDVETWISNFVVWRDFNVFNGHICSAKDIMHLAIKLSINLAGRAGASWLLWYEGDMRSADTSLQRGAYQRAVELSKAWSQAQGNADWSTVIDYDRAYVELLTIIRRELGPSASTTINEFYACQFRVGDPTFLNETAPAFANRMNAKLRDIDIQQRSVSNQPLSDKRPYIKYIAQCLRECLDPEREGYNNNAMMTYVTVEPEDTFSFDHFLTLVTNAWNVVEKQQREAASLHATVQSKGGMDVLHRLSGNHTPQQQVPHTPGFRQPVPGIAPLMILPPPPS